MQTKTLIFASMNMHHINFSVRARVREQQKISGNGLPTGNIGHLLDY